MLNQHPARSCSTEPLEKGKAEPADPNLNVKASVARSARALTAVGGGARPCPIERIALPELSARSSRTCAGNRPARAGIGESCDKGTNLSRAFLSSPVFVLFLLLVLKRGQRVVWRPK